MDWQGLSGGHCQNQRDDAELGQQWDSRNGTVRGGFFLLILAGTGSPLWCSGSEVVMHRFSCLRIQLTQSLHWKANS